MTRRLAISALASIPALLLAGCGGRSEPACFPSTEICDGIDNNCDGRIDEGFDVGAACTVGVGACQRTGVKVCAPGGLGTVCNAVAGSPTTETCNGIDDDCNGLVDDGLIDCCTPADTRSCGVNQGACTQGTQTCFSTRAWGSCLDGQGQPVVLPGQKAETCNGIDDDCDGQVDEGDPGGGASCNTGFLGVCAAGTVHCQSGALACIQNLAPSAEVCDGLDNDCNGVVDDAPVANMCPPTANVATTTCSAGGCAVLTCQPGWYDRNGIYADGCESST